MPSYCHCGLLLPLLEQLWQAPLLWMHLFSSS